MWKRGKRIASSLLFSKIPPSKDERDTNCRNELLFKSLKMLRFSTPTRPPFTAVQEFLFVIIRSFLKNHNRFLFPAFHVEPVALVDRVQIWQHFRKSDGVYRALYIIHRILQNILCLRAFPFEYWTIYF